MARAKIDALVAKANAAHAAALMDAVTTALVEASQAGQAWESDWHVSNEAADGGGWEFVLKVSPREP